MKGLSQWVVISLVLLLILFVIISTNLVNLNALGRSNDLMDQTKIRKECDHITCPSGCCDGDSGTNQYVKECAKNLTHEFVDVCTNEGGGIGTSHVKEYYCNGDRIENTFIDCGGDNRCSDGACAR